jgi:hypothetical protein
VALLCRWSNERAKLRDHTRFPRQLQDASFWRPTIRHVGLPHFILVGLFDETPARNQISTIR